MNTKKYKMNLTEGDRASFRSRLTGRRVSCVVAEEVPGLGYRVDYMMHKKRVRTILPFDEVMPPRNATGKGGEV